MNKKQYQRRAHSRRGQTLGRKSVVMAACVSLSLGFTLGAPTPLLADKEPVQREDRLIFSYEIYDDGTIDAVWGAGTNPTTHYEQDLQPFNILLPPDIVSRLEEAAENEYSEETTDGVLEVIIFIGGSTYGTRCHYVGGSKHCHSNSN